MRRRSRIFRHLFLDVAQHPNLIFRSFLKVLEQARIDITHLRPAQGGPGPGTPPASLAQAGAFAVPGEYTILTNPRDYGAIAEAGEECILSGLAAQVDRFLKTPAGQVYDTPYLQGVSFRLAIDTDLGLERNEYYFVWERGPLAGVVGRLDVFVRGERVETFDVPAVPALGIGTTRDEHIRLDRVADREVRLAGRVSLWITRESAGLQPDAGQGGVAPPPSAAHTHPGAGAPHVPATRPRHVSGGDGRGPLALANRGSPDVRTLVDAVPLPPGQVLPLLDGARVAVGPDIAFTFVAEQPPFRAMPAVSELTPQDIEEALGFLGMSLLAGASESAAAETLSLPGRPAGTGWAEGQTPSDPSSRAPQTSPYPKGLPGGEEGLCAPTGGGEGMISRQPQAAYPVDVPHGSLSAGRTGNLRGPGVPPARALRCLEVVGSVLTTQMFDAAPQRVLSLGSSGRCHIVVKGPGVRPVHAELALERGRLFLGNRSGRRAVHVGPQAVAVTPGDRRRLAPGDRMRLGDFLARLAEPFSPIAGPIWKYFGANYLGNLLFDEPQARLALPPACPWPITIGRDAACDWVLQSPYLWPAHAEVMTDGEPRIRPASAPPNEGQVTLFVNMQQAVEPGASHVLHDGDHVVLGNLILRYRESKA